MIAAMRSASSVPDGRYGWMGAYGVTLYPACRAGVLRGSHCPGCGRVIASRRGLWRR